MKKICALRKSQHLPNVYLRNELEIIAKKKGFSGSEIKKLKKKELCALLKIKWKYPPLKSPQKKSKVKLIFFDERPCNTRRSKLNPEAFDKKELENLVIKYLLFLILKYQKRLENILHPNVV